MSRTYAVTWEEPGVPSRAGKLELLAGALRLEGSNGGGPSTLVVPYDELVGLRLAPSGQRLGGRPTLMVDRGGRGILRLASIAAPGAVSEIADELSALRRASAGRR
jgi:hypothetical protein